jgi:hypothetical protein
MSAARRDPNREPSVDPLDDRPPAAAGATVLRVTELLGVAQETTQGMLDAEEALQGLRARFGQTEDTDAQAELAAEALDHVERQLALMRERRRLLDGVEGTLWSRRNRLERFLIEARGTAWWRAHRNKPRGERQEPGAPWND